MPENQRFLAEVENKIWLPQTEMVAGFKTGNLEDEDSLCFVVDWF